MRRRVLLLGVVAASCASPEPVYYTLAPVPFAPVPSPSAMARGDAGEGRQGAASGAGSPAGGPRTVQLRRPGLAGYLDRPEIVRGGGPYRLSVAGAERWGESLGDLIGRVTAENLAARLPGATVFTEAGSITADPDATVELDVQRFDADASGQVVLLAQVSVQRGREREGASTRTLRLTAAPASDGTADLVAAMSRTLGQLADEVSQMLRAGTRASARPASRQGRTR